MCHFIILYKSHKKIPAFLKLEMKSQIDIKVLAWNKALEVTWISWLQSANEGSWKIIPGAALRMEDCLEGLNGVVADTVIG